MANTSEGSSWDYLASEGRSRVPLGMVCLSTAACGDRKDFFAVHAYFAFPSEMQNTHELQKRFKQRLRLCLQVSIAPAALANET
jgi:hypothetical protein